MSRVEDDRDAARVAARLAEAKRAEQAKNTEKSAAASTFSKLVQSQKGAAQQLASQKTQQQTQESTNSAHDAIAQLLGQTDAKQADAAHQGARQGTNHAQTRLGSKSFESRVKEGSSQEGAATARAKDASDQGQSQLSSGRSMDQGSIASRTAGRGQDARASNSRLEDRKASSDSAAASNKADAVGGGARAEKGDLKTDSDKGGGGQQGKDSKSESAAAPSFRFNPALMAPVAVQKKNETQSSDRLRKAASEIAQKIVERVRVGTNAAGRMEFQIDMKSDVLGGMSVKVSAKNGKISAVFSGSDKEILKMLEEQSDALTKALGARGLTLESLKTEAKA